MSKRCSGEINTRYLSRGSRGNYHVTYNYPSVSTCTGLIREPTHKTACFESGTLTEYNLCSRYGVRGYQFRGASRCRVHPCTALRHHGDGWAAPCPVSHGGCRHEQAPTFTSFSSPGRRWNRVPGTSFGWSCGGSSCGFHTLAGFTYPSSSPSTPIEASSSCRIVTLSVDATGSLFLPRSAQVGIHCHLSPDPHTTDSHTNTPA